jgi:hypothetical protein
MTHQRQTALPPAENPKRVAHLGDLLTSQRPNLISTRRLNRRAIGTSTAC